MTYLAQEQAALTMLKSVVKGLEDGDIEVNTIEATTYPQVVGDKHIPTGHITLRVEYAQVAVAEEFVKAKAEQISPRRRG